MNKIYEFLFLFLKKILYLNKILHIIKNKKQKKQQKKKKKKTQNGKNLEFFSHWLIEIDIANQNKKYLNFFFF